MQTLVSWVAIAACLAACSKPADQPPPPSAAPAAAPADTHASGIAWKSAASDADVDAAFTLARAEKKPVFVYWGAKWCPPCNQVKATLFNRQDFIERSRAFVAVYVDGDSPGAQKLGTRFRIRGYPTMLLFTPDGRELTRLPGEVDAAQYTQVLTLGMNAAQRPVKAVLADARAGASALTANDWRLLAFYSWDTDEQQLVTKAELPAVLKQIAARCPADQAETATRLLLKSLAATDEKAPPSTDPAARERLLQLLARATGPPLAPCPSQNAAPDCALVEPCGRLGRKDTPADASEHATTLPACGGGPACRLCPSAPGRSPDPSTPPWRIAV